MKLNRIQRLLQLITALQSQRSPAADQLAAELGVSRRTVFRDLKLLESAGLPLHFDPVSQGYALDRDFFLPPVHLTMDEAMALLMMTRKFLHRTPLPDADVATRAAMKLESVLPSDIQEHVGPLLDGLEVLSGPEPDKPCDAGLFHQIQRAVAERRRVLVRYDSLYDQREIEAVLRPYRLIFYSRSWYLLAYSEHPEHNEVRTFKLERMISGELMDRTFPDDPGFNVGKYFGNAWQFIRGEGRHQVRIRFLPQVASNVEEVRWHRTQKTRRLEDGSLIFEVEVDGLKEITWWILGYGEQAVVEAPEELRVLMGERTRRMTEHYEAPAV